MTSIVPPLCVRSSAEPTEEQAPVAVQPTVIQANQGGDDLLIGDLLSLDIGAEPVTNAASVDLTGKYMYRYVHVQVLEPDQL